MIRSFFAISFKRGWLPLLLIAIILAPLPGAWWSKAIGFLVALALFLLSQFLIWVVIPKRVRKRKARADPAAAGSDEEAAPGTRHYNRLHAAQPSESVD